MKAKKNSEPSMPAASIHIREARLPQDIPVVHAFILGLQIFEHAFEPNRRVDAAVASDYLADLEKKIREGNGVILIAEREPGHPIGWAAAYESEDEIYVVPEERRIGYIAELYIVEEARGLGGGRRLIGACENWARQRGLPLITIGVLPNNKRAFALYERSGYNSNAVLLRKYLR
jgi:ribosomal protein S18 acetylase RimI-like enzyme